MGQWIPILSVGAFIGVDNTFFSIAIASLLFSGPLASGLGLAVSASIISTLIMGVIIALFSQIRSNVANVQDLGVAVLAQSLAVLVASQALPDEVRIATAFAIITLSTLSSAFLLWITGLMGWGGVVRFFPQSVLAGFLSGTGWLLAAGGFSVATGIAMSELFHMDQWTQKALLNGLPALAMGLILFFSQRYIRWKGTLITLIAGAIVGFHILLRLTSTPISEAQAQGWLAKVDTQMAGLPDLTEFAAKTDWGLVGAALPVIATVAFLTLIGTLLNTSALSTLSGQDADTDRELRLHGVANLVVAAFAGPPGHTGISPSQLALRAGVTRRGAGLVMSVVVILALFNMTTLLPILPLFVTSGLIIFLGLDFLYDWLIVTQRCYSKSEWAIVVFILGCVILFGFAEAILAGLLLASLIFAWHYASVPVLRRTGSLRDFTSTLARAPLDAAWLRANGDAVEVIELQGFMFFGTADRLYGHVQNRINDEERPPLSQLIIDFQHVVGLDAAAASRLTRIVAVAEQNKIRLIFSGYPRDVLTTLTRAAPALLALGGAHGLPSLDEALEAAEDALLDLAPPNRPVLSMMQRLEPSAADLPHLERLFAALPQERHAKGEVILPAGTIADSLVFLETGRVAIRAPSQNGDGPRLRAMSSGAILGDIGLALQATRTADVIAETDVMLRRLSLADMERIEAEDPALSNALHRLQRRSLAEKIVIDERLSRMATKG